MGNVNCNIIKDLLPLYVDEVVSSDTKKMVSDHLHQCESCRKEAESMRATVQVPIQQDSKPLKRLKKKWGRKQILIGVMSAVVSAAIAVSLCFFLFIYGFPASSQNIMVETEFQYNEDYYLNQEWVILFKLKDGNHLIPITDIQYATDEDGNKVETGYVVTLREVPISNSRQSSNYTLGYGYNHETPPNAEYDFTVTVKYKDETVIYSMSKEGLFLPQENVIKYR